MKQGEAKAFVTDVVIFRKESELKKEEEIVKNEDNNEIEKATISPNELRKKFARLKKSLRGKSSSIL